MQLKGLPFLPHCEKTGRIMLVSVFISLPCKTILGKATNLTPARMRDDCHLVYKTTSKNLTVILAKTLIKQPSSSCIFVSKTLINCIKYKSPSR